MNESLIKYISAGWMSFGPAHMEGIDGLNGGYLLSSISVGCGENVGILQNVDGFCVHHVDIVLFC